MSTVLPIFVESPTLFFASRGRHTSWTGDWSSDVCSSDLFIVSGIANGLALVHNRSSLQRSTDPAQRPAILALLMSAGAVMTTVGVAGGGAIAALVSIQIGRASCRERV